MSNYSIVLRHSDRLSGAAIKLREGVQSVGRGATCDIVISHASVSRLHAELVVKGISVALFDMKSRNGTFVDEEAVKTARLTHGSRLRFGSIELVLAIVGAAFDENEADVETGSISVAGDPPPIEIERLRLTPAERRVFNHLVKGRAEKAVAVRLNISRHTVHNHVREIYRKMGVRSRAELLARFVDNASDSRVSSLSRTSKRRM